MALLISGLLVLLAVHQAPEGAMAWTARFGSVTAVVAPRRVSPLIGYLMAQGWIIGAEGFSPANSLPPLSGIILILVWSGWLLVSALFGKDPPSRDRAQA